MFFSSRFHRFGQHGWSHGEKYSTKRKLFIIIFMQIRNFVKNKRNEEIRHKWKMALPIKLCNK